MAEPRERHRVVIVGAGFAGFNAARELSKLVGTTTEIVVINSTDYFLYLPLMPQVSGGLIEPAHVLISLPSRLRKTRFVLGTVNHAPTRAAVTAERTLLAALEAGCSAPVGAYAIHTGGSRLHLEGIVLGAPEASFQPAVLDSTSANGRMVIRERGEAKPADAARLGRELAERMLALGAAGLMRAEQTNGNDAHD